jgi:ornithine carbamoyltransferase
VSPTDFVTIRDFAPRQIAHLLELAGLIKAAPQCYSKSLQGKSLAMIFEKPSLRTRITFDIGMYQLGGHAVYLSPAEIQLGKRESVYDVAKNLERMADAIMIRTFAHEIAEQMAQHASIPVINGLTDYSHPCQAIADYLTILEIKGQIRGLKIAYIGDGNNVAHSLMFCGAQLGAHVAIASPPGYEPKEDACKWARARSAHTRGTCLVTNDPWQAAHDADVIYTDTWISMGAENEAEKRRQLFREYQVSTRLFAHTKADAIFMHCLPAHRGEEVTADVIDSKRSVVFEQAENRLHAQKAIMLELMSQGASQQVDVPADLAAVHPL